MFYTPVITSKLVFYTKLNCLHIPPPKMCELFQAINWKKGKINDKA